MALSLVKTVLSLALAILLAWIVARTDTPGRGVLEVLITLPFFIPPILTATAWAMLGNAQVGTINLVWRWLTGARGPLVDVYSYGGIVWHMMQYSTPFIFLFVVDAFRAMDPSLEESSRMSGASRWQTFWRITFGLMLPVTTSAFLLSFIRGMESFESAVFFGTPVGIKVLTTQIYDLITQRAQPDYQSATAMGFAAMALMFLLLVVQSRLLRGRSFTTVTGKGYSPNVMRLGWMRWVTFAICVAFFALTVALPVGQLLLELVLPVLRLLPARHADLRSLPQRLGESTSSGAPSATPCCWASSAPRRPWCWAASSPTSRRARPGAAGG